MIVSELMDALKRCGPARRWRGGGARAAWCCTYRKRNVGLGRQPGSGMRLVPDRQDAVTFRQYCRNRHRDNTSPYANVEEDC